MAATPPLPMLRGAATHRGTMTFFPAEILMRVVSAVLVGLLVAVALGLTLASRDSTPSSEPSGAGPSVRTAVTPPTPRRAPVLHPVPDPAAATPRPGTPARRRAPDAPARLRLDVDVVGPGAGALTDVEVCWARAEDDDRFRRQQWQASNPSIYVEPGPVWLHAVGGRSAGYRSKPVYLLVERGEPRPSVRLVLEADSASPPR